MMKIAIVEDALSDSKLLEQSIDVYARENNLNLKTSVYRNGIDFLSSYQSDTAIVFMDIDLPMENGLEISKKLRKIDEAVVIIFTTNLAQFAVNGYEVEALDFLVKPINSYSFSTMFARALSKAKKKGASSVVIGTRNLKKVSSDEIVYVEMKAHHIVYHLKDGKQCDIYGVLKEAEKQLPKDTFVRCNSGYLVNLNYVEAIGGNSVRVAGEELLISRPRKKEFLNAVINHFKEES